MELLQCFSTFLLNRFYLYLILFYGKISIYLHCIQLMIVQSFQMTNPLYNTRKKKVSRSLSCILIFFLSFKREKSKLRFYINFIYLLFFKVLLFFFINQESITHLNFDCIQLIALYNSITYIIAYSLVITKVHRETEREKERD